MGYLIGVAMVTFTVLIISMIWKNFMVLFWRPYALTRHFQKQGVRGPPYSFLFGSLHEIRTMMKDAREKVMDNHSHDITQMVLPHYQKWSSIYGETFMYWYGTQPRICIPDPDLAKEILSNKFGFYSKLNTRPLIKTMIGNGLALVKGLDWVRHRRILNPAFSMDKLKVMISRMAECTISMLDEWQSQALEAKDQIKTIEVNQEFRELTADIIAHTAFGASFAQGREAFDAQRELQKYCTSSSLDVSIPGSQYLPTQSNLQIWKLDGKVKKSLNRIIESRLHLQSSNGKSHYSYGDDLLGVMMDTEKSNAGPKMNMNEIMEECKTFFFTGHETTSNWLTWAVFLLSLHKDWQEKLRQEVLQNCGMEIPDANMLSKLKMDDGRGLRPRRRLHDSTKYNLISAGEFGDDSITWIPFQIGCAFAGIMGFQFVHWCRSSTLFLIVVEDKRFGYPGGIIVIGLLRDLNLSNIHYSGVYHFNYSSDQVPAVGVSLEIEKVFAIMEQHWKDLNQ